VVTKRRMFWVYMLGIAIGMYMGLLLGWAIWSR
jgi:hypothetical protein